MTLTEQWAALKDYLATENQRWHPTAAGDDPEADEMAQACAISITEAHSGTLAKMRELETGP